MTIVSEAATAPAAPAPRTRATDVLVALLLIAAELVLSWYTYDIGRTLSHHVGATRPIQWFFLMLPFLPLAVVVSLRALSRRRAVAAGLVALGAGAVLIAYNEFLRWLGTHRSLDLSFHQMQALGYVVVMAIAVLASLAWGLSRRHGRWWPLGLLVAAGGAALTVWTNWPEHVGWGHAEIAFVVGDDNPIRRFYLVHEVARMLPVIAACVVCWLIDSAELRRTPDSP